MTAGVAAGLADIGESLMTHICLAQYGPYTCWCFEGKGLPSSEKEVLDHLFLLISVKNAILTFVWKSFPFIYSTDVAAMAALYA